MVGCVHLVFLRFLLSSESFGILEYVVGYMFSYVFYHN